MAWMKKPEAETAVVTFAFIVAMRCLSRAKLQAVG
jgi:hypothetical protein